MAQSTPKHSGYTIIDGATTGKNSAKVNTWLEYKVTQDTTANTSTVDVYLYARANTSGLSTSWDGTRSYGSITFNGTSHAGASISGYDFRSTSIYNEFAHYSETVTHNSDGTKSITLSGSWDKGASTSEWITGGNVSTTTVTLPTIPRASSVSSLSVALGASGTITVTKASSSFYHELSYSFQGLSGSIGTRTQSTSITFTPPSSFLAKITSTSATGTITCKTYTSSTSATAIGTKTSTLTVTIPKATLSNISKTMSDSNISLAVSNRYADTSMYVTITYDFGSKTSQAFGSRTNADTVSGQFPVSLASQIPNATSGTGTIKVSTYHYVSGNYVSIGSNSYTLTLTVPTNIKATGTLTLSKNNSNSVVNSWGVWLQGYTKVNASLTTSTSSSGGATVKSVAISGEGINASGTGTSLSATSTSTLGSSTLTYTGTVTDSRGRTDTKTQSVTPIAYAQPSVNGLSIQRYDTSSSAISDEGQAIRISFTSSFASVSNKNNCKFFLQYRLSTTSSWTTVQTALATHTATNTTYTGTYSAYTFLSTKAYAVRIMIQDGATISNTWTPLNTTYSATINIPTAERVLNVNSTGSGLGIGGFSTEAGKLQVYYPTDFESTTLPTINGNNFIREAKGYALYQKELIPSGADLNDYLTAGSYYSSANADVQAMSNCPTSFAFNMRVDRTIGQTPAEASLTWKGVIQTIWDYYGNHYQRNIFYNESGINIGVWSKINNGYIRDIGSGENLNDIIIDGDYYVRQNSGVSNIPVDDYGFLKVYAYGQPNATGYAKRIEQRFIRLLGQAEYRRVYANTSWQSWYRIANYNDISYTSGNTFSANLYVNGYITSSTTSINLGVWVPKSMADISSIAVTRCTGGIRGIAGYVNGSSDSYNWLSQSDITVTATKASDNFVRLYITKTSAFTNATNNTPIGMYCALTLSFS